MSQHLKRYRILKLSSEKSPTVYLMIDHHPIYCRRSSQCWLVFRFLFGLSVLAVRKFATQGGRECGILSHEGRKSFTYQTQAVPGCQA